MHSVQKIVRKSMNHAHLVLLSCIDCSFFLFKGLKIDEIDNKLCLIQTNGGDPIHIRGRIKLLKCEICDRIFTQEYVLRVHRASHSNERPFECWLCHKT